MSSAKNYGKSREEIFDQFENDGRARLDRSLKLFDEAAVPEGLADRTCQKIWDTLDHPEHEQVRTGPAIPKFPRLVRSTKKGTPFVLKAVSVYQEVPPAVPTTLPAAEPVPLPAAESIPLPAAESIAIAPIVEPTVQPAVIVPINEAVTLDDLKRSFAEQARHPRRRKRSKSPLCNGEIREEARDEYYWEILPPETDAEKRRRLERLAKKNRSRSTQPAAETPNPFTDTVTRIGEMTLSSVRSATSWLGPEQKKPHSSKKGGAASTQKRGRPTDLLISIVSGVLIAVIVVFPTLRFVGRELAIVIAKSTVRRIGQKVQVSADQSTMELFPLLSEQLLHPQLQEVEFQSEPTETAPGEPLFESPEWPNE